ncbi:hypothetical protein AQUCO_08500020v1 [Aquilegia coerulea]|uniref:Uncharacterized protein n=1 Tax=Aquilegia coerulea TaxID=218851 RepID=A0A2G5C6M6_AQUCA|nr:hypothetical protein AQUCO_08500020v1 [Aquilegia coerulea]
MECIHNHYQLLPISSHVKLKNNSKTAKLLWLPIKEPTDLVRRQQNFSSILSQRTQVLNNSSLLVGLTSSPSIATATTNTGPNITVFIATSASLLFLYWIANFFVPSIVIKHLDSTNSNDEQESDDNNHLNVERPVKNSGFEQSSEL